MMVNDLYESRKNTSAHLVLNARDLPRHLAFDLALETGSSVGNATSLALLRHFLAFTSIRRAGQRTSGLLPCPPCPRALASKAGLFCFAVDFSYIRMFQCHLRRAEIRMFECDLRRAEIRMFVCDRRRAERHTV